MEFETIKTFIENNQFLAGGIGTVTFGFALASLRRVPSLCWEWFRRQFVVTVEITQDKSAFHHMERFLHRHPSASKIRSVKIHGDAYLGAFEGMRMQASPSVGSFIIWEGRRPILLTRTRKELDNASGASAFFETIVLSTLGRDKNRLVDLVQKAANTASILPKGKMQVYTADHSAWHGRTAVNARDIRDVVLNEGLMESLLTDAKRFFTSERWYRDRGIPHRRGWLLHGPPGCGKTSLISALGNELRKTVYVINASDPYMDDNKFANLIGNVNPNSIVVIEDADAAFTVRPEKTQSFRPDEPADPVNRLTLSGVLNALDGIFSAESRLLIMTTNYPDRLDAALVRPGRIDRRVLLDKATKYQAGRMFDRFFPGDEEARLAFVAEYVDKSKTPAELQELLLNRAQDCEALNQLTANEEKEESSTTEDLATEIECPFEGMAPQSVHVNYPAV